MRQCVEISRSWNLELRKSTMEHLCCHSRGPMKRENQPAAFFSGPSATTPFTVAKKSPRSRRLDSFIHAFVGSMTRRRGGRGEGEERDRSRRLNDDESGRKVGIEKSRFHDPPFGLSSCTTAAGAFDDRNKSKGPLRNVDSATISRLLRVLASAFGYGSLKSEAWMRVQVMYGVSLFNFRRDFSNLSYLR